MTSHSENVCRLRLLAFQRAGVYRKCVHDVGNGKNVDALLRASRAYLATLNELAAELKRIALEAP